MLKNQYRIVSYRDGTSKGAERSLPRALLIKFSKITRTITIIILNLVDERVLPAWAEYPRDTNFSTNGAEDCMAVYTIDLGMNFCLLPVKA